MPTVLLVRHAQASYGGADYDVLSELGRRQCAVLAADLARRGLVPDRVVSGTLRRQRQSAELLAPAGVEVEIDAGWDEYDADDVLGHHSQDRARLEGGAGPQLTHREFQVVMDGGLTGWVQAGSTSTSDEPHPRFAGRVGTALDRLAAGLAPGSTAMVCTSGGVIAQVVVRVLGVDPLALVPLNRASVNTSVTRLVVGGRGVSLLTFNEYPHLDGDAVALRTMR